MATSEHVLTLKAKLDTSDVQSQIQQLNNSGGGSAGGAAHDVDKLSGSLKNLKNAIGGGVLVKSFTDFAKAAKLFGENTPRYVQMINSSMQSLMAAISTGNPVIIALTAAFSALSLAAEEATQKVSEEVIAERRRLANENAKETRYKRQQNDILNSTIRSGNELALTTQLQSAYSSRAFYERQSSSAATTSGIKEAEKNIAEIDVKISKLESAVSKAVQKTINTLYKQNDRESLEGMVKVLKSGQFTYGNRGFDYSVIEQLQTSIQKLKEQEQKTLEERVEKEKNAAKDLDEARQKFKISEEQYSAAKNRDMAYFREQMKRAQQAMANATTAQQFTEAASYYTNARSQIESIEKSKDKGTRIDYSKMMEMLAGSAVSNFSAAGFGMGEQMNITSTVENQLNEVIRLMQEQLRKDLKVVNSSYTL